MLKDPEDCARYKKSEDADRTYVFMASVNQEFDESEKRSLSRKPLPSIRKVFSEIRLEESQKKSYVTFILDSHYFWS